MKIYEIPNTTAVFAEIVGNAGIALNFALNQWVTGPGNLILLYQHYVSGDITGLTGEVLRAEDSKNQISETARPIPQAIAGALAVATTATKSEIETMFDTYNISVDSVSGEFFATGILKVTQTDTYTPPISGASIKIFQTKEQRMVQSVNAIQTNVPIVVGGNTTTTATANTSY